HFAVPSAAAAPSNQRRHARARLANNCAPAAASLNPSSSSSTSSSLSSNIPSTTPSIHHTFVIGQPTRLMNVLSGANGNGAGSGGDAVRSRWPLPHDATTPFSVASSDVPVDPDIDRLSTSTEQLMRVTSIPPPPRQQSSAASDQT